MVTEREELLAVEVIEGVIVEVMTLDETLEDAFVVEDDNSDWIEVERVILEDDGVDFIVKRLDTWPPRVLENAGGGLGKGELAASVSCTGAIEEAGGRRGGC